jgi:hypothetical protein
MRRFVISLICGVALIATSATSVLSQSAPNITGQWTVEQGGLNGTTTSKLSLRQSGNGIVGNSPTTKNSFTGEFVNATQINGKWSGPGGAGWLTIYVTPNGHSFNGTWGYNGRAANGSFVGNKVLPPSPITPKGTWNVVGAGGPAYFVGTMKCTQSGPSVICSSNNYKMEGKFRTRTKVRANWNSGGKSGWFSFWFNDDNNSFNGAWGYGAETTPQVGRVVGQRAL